MATVFSKGRLSSPIHKQFVQNAISHTQVKWSYHNAHASKRAVRKLRKRTEKKKLRTYLKISLDLEKELAMLLGSWEYIIICGHKQGSVCILHRLAKGTWLCKLDQINTFTAKIDHSRFNNLCLRLPASTLVDLIFRSCSFSLGGKLVQQLQYM
jgi:hypothetical protein